MFTWQWWVAQTFVFIALIFVIISTQQKTLIKISAYKGISTLISFFGLCFLGQIPAIILNGISVLRSIMVMFFIYHPNLKKQTKCLLTCSLLVILVTLNILLWENIYNLFSILIATALIFTYIQKNPHTLRIMICIVSLFSAVFYLLIQSPMNCVIDLFGCCSALVGIFRIDLKKQTESNTNANVEKDNLEDNNDTDYYGEN